MPRLGEIALRFGASGLEGEVPLRFTARPLNLFVGPNNAGKSLILRELSGIDPRRARRTPFQFLLDDEDEKERKVVADVDWDDATVREREAVVLDRIRARDEWRPFTPSADGSMLGALDAAPGHLDAIRGELVLQLVGLLREHADESTKAVFRLFERNGFDAMGVSELVVKGAIALALNSAGNDGQSPLLATLLGAWERVCRIFEPLGIDVSLRSDDLSAVRSVLLSRLNEAAMHFGRTQQVTVERPSAEQVALVERLDTVLRWFLNPSPLKRLSRLADEERAEWSWSNSAVRAKAGQDWLYLDGLARLGVTSECQLTPFGRAHSDELPISILLRDAERRSRLRSLVYDAFGRYLVIDIATSMPNAVWRLSSTPPADGVETGYTASAAEYHTKAQPLSERSDGVHAYVGMLAAILAEDRTCVFIDEPEAFLHPPLVRKLARQLADISRTIGTQFFIATHSPDLVASCAASASASIIRLTHEDSRSTARLLDAKALHDLALDPLFRSEATFAALFQDGAVICEAPADKLLYQEINERLLTFAPPLGVESCVYANAQNWQTTARIAAPLRRMGVAAAMVLDADVLFQGELRKVLEAAQLPELIRGNIKQACSQLRESVVSRLEVADKDGKRKADLKRDVLRQLTSEERESFDDLIHKLRVYGVFVVPVGELEDWFPEFGFNPAHKAEWLPRVLHRLGADPEMPEYVRPAADGIWAFVAAINEWIRNPNRKGTVGGE